MLSWEEISVALGWEEGIVCDDGRADCGSRGMGKSFFAT